MYGWRGRIGLLVPSTNTAAEMEFYQAIPDGVSLHTARFILPEVQDKKQRVSSLTQMDKKEVIRASKEVACVNPGVIAYACTAGSFVKGLAYDTELIEEIETETGIKAMTTSRAVVDALKAMNLRRIAVATPYIQELDEKEKLFLEQSIPGLEVIAIEGLGILSAFEKGNLDPRVAYVSGRKVDSGKAEAILLSCGAWRTLDIIESLERDVGKPVISSNQATLWAALKVLGIPGLSGYGRLLQRF